MSHVRPRETVESALRASDSGMLDRDNAELHGVAIKTIRRWRRVYHRRGLPRGQEATTASCPRCHDDEHIIRWAWNTWPQVAVRAESVLRDHPDIAVVRLRSPAEVDRWRATLG